MDRGTNFQPDNIYRVKLILQNTVIKYKTYKAEAAQESAFLLKVLFKFSVSPAYFLPQVLGSCNVQSTSRQNFQLLGKCWCEKQWHSASINTEK